MGIAAFFRNLFGADARTIRRLQVKLYRQEVDPILIRDILAGRAAGPFGNPCLRQLHEMVERGGYVPAAFVKALDFAIFCDEKKRILLETHPPLPAIRLIKTPVRQLSKLGGDPNLPQSIAWPKNPEGVELDFLAQIHCPELPPGLGLPATGTFFLFYDCRRQAWGYEDSDREYWRFFHNAEALPETRRTRQIRREYPLEFREAYLTFEPFESFVVSEDESQGQHHMLGYPCCIQDEDMAPGKVLLLQIDSDEEGDGPGWMWGDCGRLFFWIAPDDLAGGRFDRISLIGECY